MDTPLGVLGKVRPASRSLDPTPFVLVLVCAALVAVISSNFIYTPGMYVGFNNVPAAASTKIQIPVSRSGDMAKTATTVTLVSARGTGIYVVAGRVVDREGLKNELHKLALKPGTLSRPVLVKADSLLTLQSFVGVCDLIRAEGFPGILIATNE
jgi:biopolymer transport protein ExbD